MITFSSCIIEGTAQCYAYIYPAIVMFYPKEGGQDYYSECKKQCFPKCTHWSSGLYSLELVGTT